MAADLSAENDAAAVREGERQDATGGININVEIKFINPIFEVIENLVNEIVKAGVIQGVPAPFSIQEGRQVYCTLPED